MREQEVVKWTKDNNKTVKFLVNFNWKIDPSLSAPETIVL